MSGTNFIDMGAYSIDIFEVGRVSRLRYVEGERSLVVETEMLATRISMAMNATGIDQWEPPHNGERIDDRERHRILDNIEHAFHARGWELQVMWPFGDRMSDGTWQWSTDGQAGFQ